MAQTPTETPLSRREQRHESHTASTYAAFLAALCAEGPLERGLAECAAPAVVHALLQRIQPTEARDLEAQLPRKLVELLPPREAGPEVGKSREEFLRAVGEALRLEPAAVEPVVRAVLVTVREHISQGEARDVEHNLRADLRELWGRRQ
jgi:uncharacterized protein (DUF2267 family)